MGKTAEWGKFICPQHQNGVRPRRSKEDQEGEMERQGGILSQADQGCDTGESTKAKD